MVDFIVKYNTASIIERVESPYYKQGIPDIQIGDTIELNLNITEGGAEKTQNYKGVVIASRNTGINKTITVRKISRGIGVEKTFLVHSPLINNITVLTRAKVRRAKLFYLRKLSGKKTRLKQRFN